MNVTGSCKNGLLIPAVAPSHFHAFLYFGALLYLFLGTAIIADIFMGAIEKITTATRKVRKRKPTAVETELMREGEDDDDLYEYVPVWNGTVANLTLMALGSSSPEILLSLIELAGNGFQAGDLGPGTIIGSAAFNIFCISAICIFSVPSPSSKHIEGFGVFCTTTAFAVFAYLWLLVILTVISPNVVEVWEAALTLLFFVILVILAYLVDVQPWKKDIKKDEAKEDGMEKKAEGGSLELQPQGGPLPLRQLSREITRVYPSLSPEDHAKLLAYRVNKSTRHDRLHYRMRAIKHVTGAWGRRSIDDEIQLLLQETAAERDVIDGAVSKPTVEFSARTYGISPSDRTVQLTIVRRGRCESPLTLSYATVDGIAKKELHYFSKRETIRLEKGQRREDISIQLVEGAEWQQRNAVFYVHLRILEAEEERGRRTRLGPCRVARVRLFAQPLTLTAHATVQFVKSNYVASENEKSVRLHVLLSGRPPLSSADVHYETSDISATQNDDYVPVKDGILRFDGQEMEKYIDIGIIDDQQDEKDETFLVELSCPTHAPISVHGCSRSVVTIVSDDNIVRNVANIHRLARKHLRELRMEGRTWRDQIISASSVNGGAAEGATLTDAVLHSISMPWKVTLAILLPPPSLLGGWLCFFCSLTIIALITAVVGDVASILGCMLGLKDAVTAITLVAVGTSLPDTFASKIAAQNDPTADNAVGNITGSNSVNVFLGIGLPWLFASIYWATKSKQFDVDAGSLGYSVGIFTLLSCVCIACLFLRRFLRVFGKGELGGPFIPKLAFSFGFLLLWIVYLFLSIRNIQTEQ